MFSRFVDISDFNMHVDRLRSNHNAHNSSLEQQILGQVEKDGSQNIQESEQGDDSTLSETASSSHSACLPDSTLDADTWVKAAEFVPGQLWQSVGK